MRRYSPKEISVISAPVTSANLRNARNHPAISLGYCTPFQLLTQAGIGNSGTVGIIGSYPKAIGIVKALARRSQKPFLLLGTSGDKNLALALEAKWTLDSVQSTLPTGNGALLLSRPHSSYLELCEYMESWMQDYFIVMHLGNGLQVGEEILDLLCTAGQCVILCDSVANSIRNTDSHAISILDFLRRMNYLIAFSSGGAAKELIEVLPTYQYEKVSNTENVNVYKGRSIMHPFHGHRGHGFSVGQTRTMEYNKNLFEQDELKMIFDEGNIVVYNTRNGNVYLTSVT